MREKDVKMGRCIRLCLDCADMCVLCSQYMSRDSEFSKKIGGQCADICDACAAECDKFDMDMCKECARICKACASECRKIAY